MKLRAAKLRALNVQVEVDPAVSFERTQALLRGAAPVPLTAVGSKMLWYMLEDGSGCDAWLTPQRFVVQYGWHLAHHRYFADVAVEVASWLCDRLGGPCGVLPAGRLPAFKPVHAWGHGPRYVWIDATDETIRFVVRRATSPVLPATPPEPIESLAPPKVYVPGTWPCPSCGEVPDRYRSLGGDCVVCLACGASSHR